MNTIQVLNVKLQRTDPNVSWGFVVQGGMEFHSPLVVQKVNANSLADQAGVRCSDYILKIGPVSTENLTHTHARNTIVSQGNYLELTLQRGAPPRAEDYNARFDFPKHQLMSSADPFEQRAPVASPQVGVQLGGNRALVTPSYNSPMGLYSSQNISESLVSTLKNSPNAAGMSYHAPHMTQPKFLPQAPLHPQPAPVYQPHQPSFNTQPRLFNSPPGAPPSGSRNPVPSGPRNIKRGNRGSALLNNPSSAIPTCASCGQLVRGPFISAVGKIWCPNHFVCAHPSCGMSLHDVGFIEENGRLYCERDFANFLAPKCNKCFNAIMGECCYALEKTYHPECFVCVQCKQAIGNGTFHIEDGAIYCSRDFSALFSVKCAGCDFPIEPLDKFFDALNQKWHTECFTCTTCHVPLGGTFSSKGNKPYCKRHAF